MTKEFKSYPIPKGAEKVRGSCDSKDPHDDGWVCTHHYKGMHLAGAAETVVMEWPMKQPDAETYYTGKMGSGPDERHAMGAADLWTRAEAPSAERLDALHNTQDESEHLVLTHRTAADVATVIYDGKLEDLPRTVQCTVKGCTERHGCSCFFCAQHCKAHCKPDGSCHENPHPDVPMDPPPGMSDEEAEAAGMNTTGPFPACGHSECRQWWIDSGDNRCVIENPDAVASAQVMWRKRIVH